MVDGLKEFYITKNQAMSFIKKFKNLQKENSYYDTMQILFNEALDDEITYNLILLNACKSLIDASKTIKEI